MKEKKINVTGTLVVSVASFIAGSISYFFIHNRVPVHWNVNWEIDGTAPKEIVFLLSIVPLLLYLILGTRKNSFTTRRGNHISVTACVYLFIFVQWISIARAIKPDLDTNTLLQCITGAVFMLLGNFMPTVTKNHTFGFRTPWSLTSDLSWKKTNRFGGYIMSIFGILIIVGGVFESRVVNLISLVALGAFVIIGMGLSYYYWRKDPDRT